MEKSKKDSGHTRPAEEERKSSIHQKTSMAAKYGFTKRKSSGDDDDQTKPKSAKTDVKAKPIKMSLATYQKPQEPVVKPPQKKMTVAAAFGDSSDSEPEEMPPEAKMRMKNIGRHELRSKNRSYIDRDTPTAAGPNSFGKTKYGFTDTHRKHERLVMEVAKKVDG